MQLKSTNILSPIILVAISLAGCSAEAPAGVDPRPQQVAPATSAVADASVGEVNCEDAKPPALDGIMGRYQVRSADKYRGGLTTAEHATARIGSGATITTDHFSIDDLESMAPGYSLECHDITRTEGEVPAGHQRLLGPYFGLGADRNVVWELSVDDERSGQHLAAFEVVPREGTLELWRLYDGWIYVLSRAGAEDGR